MIGGQLRSIEDLFRRLKRLCGLDGWMDGMGLVIIGRRQSKSTLGASKENKEQSTYSFFFNLKLYTGILCLCAIHGKDGFHVSTSNVVLCWKAR